MQRMKWDEICKRDDYRGRWVALDSCCYDEETGKAMEGSVVDVDDNLVDLCERLRNAEQSGCAILFCNPAPN